MTTGKGLRNGDLIQSRDVPVIGSSGIIKAQHLDAEIKANLARLGFEPR